MPAKRKKNQTVVSRPAFDTAHNSSLDDLITKFARLLDRRRADAGKITRREWMVLELLGEHLTDAQIAEQLGIKEETVRHHTASMRAKLGLATRHELYAWYIEFKGK